MNIIKVIKFDFSMDTLFKEYYQLFKMECDKNRRYANAMGNVNRTVLIDLVKAGASLFYDSLHLGLVSLIIGKQIVHGNLKRDIY